MARFPNVANATSADIYNITYNRTADSDVRCIADADTAASDQLAHNARSSSLEVTDRAFFGVTEGSRISSAAGPAAADPLLAAADAAAVASTAILPIKRKSKPFRLPKI